MRTRLVLVCVVAASVLAAGGDKRALRAALEQKLPKMLTEHLAAVDKLRADYADVLSAEEAGYLAQIEATYKALHDAQAPAPDAKGGRFVRVDVRPPTWSAYYRLDYKWQARDALKPAHPHAEGVLLTVPEGTAMLYEHRAELGADFVFRLRATAKVEGDSVVKLMTGRAPEALCVALPSRQSTTIILSQRDGAVSLLVDGQEQKPSGTIPAGGHLALLVPASAQLLIGDEELEVWQAQ